MPATANAARPARISRQPGYRTHRFDYAELAADSAELIDRTQGQLTDPGAEMSYVVADVLSQAIAYVFHEE